MVAGESSGDLLGALLLRALRSRWPGLTARGIGGPRLQAEGFDAWWPSDKLAVRGYVEVLRHYREIVGIRRALGDRLLAERPDLFIGVDAPDFNLALETRLRVAGVRTVHFISPSIWAWRAGRIEAIRAAVDHMLCVFPFEPALYAQAGIAATYVGHPLADVIPLEADRAGARRALGLDPGDVVVALLPGSRRAEIDHLAELFLRAAGLMLQARPGLRLVLPVAPGLRSAIEAALARSGLAPSRLALLDGRSHEALAACDAVLVASGTATLEAALFRKPMVIAYRMNAISWEITRRQKLQPWVGLPNILLRDFAVPELLQRDATPEALARETLRWLDDPAAAARLADRFGGLHRELRRDTATTAARVIAEVLDGSSA
ncbi:MAG: lipid-A-disaccharide synthase [Ideonella sp.]|jgi:lipid-A-disaccharide synthase|nr:lipid-A-disaccharide synthase [Ideonella sp.]